MSNERLWNSGLPGTFKRSEKSRVKREVDRGVYGGPDCGG